MRQVNIFELTLSRVSWLISIICYLVLASCNGQVGEAESGPNIRKLATIPVVANTNDQKAMTSSRLSKIDKQISDVVRTVFQDSKGRFWFGTQNGAFRLEEGSLIRLDSIQNEMGQGVTIKDISEDKNGRIWFGHTGGVSVIDGDTTINYYEKDGLLSNDVWCITIDTKNQLWIGSINGVNIFDGTVFTTFEIPEGKIDKSRGVSSKKMIHDIMEDSHNRMWFSTNGGVYIKDGDKLNNLSETDGLGSNFVNQVMEDRDGVFWISTSDGLYTYDNKVLTNITRDIITSFKGTGSILQDTDGNIWFNSNLRDIYRIDGSDFTKYRIEEGDSGPAPFHIYEDQLKRLWFVGYGGAYRYEKDTFINIKKNGPW